MFWFFRISFFLVRVIVLLLSLLFGCGFTFFNSLKELLRDVLLFDGLSFYFIMLVLMLGIYTQFYFLRDLSMSARIFLFLSLFFRCLRFFVKHSLLFWCFYELSMLPLLYLIFRCSPYSERFLAGWYFSCYLIVTSLPLVLIIFYIRLVKNRFLFTVWDSSGVGVRMLVVLSFIFFTKVPLVPFHTWLPIVHAEARSIVSIFLSGYIMKLGLLGVYRCCKSIFDRGFLFYILLCLCVCIMFLVTACSELDGKRWLAFLSLSHIVVPFFAFFISDWTLIRYSFFYCLGHGLSAGLVFSLLWFMYNVCGSRKWLLIKSSIAGNRIMLYFIFSLLRLCSFPTTIQFFCEVGLVSCRFFKLIYMLFWCFYLFLGGLVPLVLIGHSLIRCEYIDRGSGEFMKFFNVFFFLCFWCYLGLFIL